MERLLDPDRPQRSRERSPVASDASFSTARNRERMATSPPANPPANSAPIRVQNQLQVDHPDNEPRHQDPRDRQPSRHPSHDDHDDQVRPRRGSTFSYSPIYAPRVLERLTPAPQAQPRTTPAPHTNNLRSQISPIRDFEPSQFSMDGVRLPTMKAPKFQGKDGEDVVDWLNRMETHFMLYRVPERIQASYAAERLKREARTYYVDCIK